MSNKNLVAIPDNVTEIGPFDGKTTPARPGMYRRVSPKSGRKVWAWWDGSRWCKFSTNIDKALEKSKRSAGARNGRSRRHDLPWYGLSMNVATQPTPAK